MKKEKQKLTPNRTAFKPSKRRDMYKGEMAIFSKEFGEQVDKAWRRICGPRLRAEGMIRTRARDCV